MSLFIQNISLNENEKFYTLLRISCLLIFLGRAYEFYFFSAPYRSILWDESLLTPIVEGVFKTPWNEYATSLTVNKWIDFSIKLSGIILLFSGIISIFWEKIRFKRVKKTILGFGIFILFFLSLCLVKNKNYDWLQFFELSIQLAAPLLLFFYKDATSINRLNFSLCLKIAVAITFISHGIFAMGLLYVPGYFIDMTIQILKVSESNAKLFLLIAGILDIAMSILIFIPKYAKIALIYMIFWGILTAFARLTAGFNYHFIFNSFHQNLYLTIYKLPHGILPLSILILHSGSQEINSSKQ